MRTLAVFARIPGPGRVKTRLSPALPADRAARLYRALLDDTLSDAAACRADAHEIWWTGDGQAPEFPGWSARRQLGGPLGERLANAFGERLQRPGDRAVVIGSDCPGLRAAVLGRAFEALDASEVVLGPATDGGYWLLGLTRPAPGLFENIEWSSPRVREQTEARANALGLTLARLPQLSDLDTPADLADLIGALAAGEPACGPATLAKLRDLGLAR